MKKSKTGLLLLLPSFLLTISVIIIPIIITFGYSLKEYNLTEPDNTKFVGLQNYKAVLTSTAFHNALINSLFVLFFVIIIGLCLSLVTASILNHNSRITPLLTAIVIIPWALPPMVNGIMWKFIFFPGYGLLNNILIKLHLITEPISWITNRYLFLLVVSIVIVWRVVPFTSIVILANLQNIPKDYYDSINLAGGNKLQGFRFITLPLLIPSLAVALINLTTTAINVFDEIIAISGYDFQNQTLLVYNYSNTFNFLDFGLGSSISYIIMLITGIFGFFYIKNMTIEKVY